MYYREFGIPARIARCYGIDQLKEHIERYNGKKNCYTSVYVFNDREEVTEGKTNYESAALNTVWFDFDDKDNVELCLKDVRKFIKKFCDPLNIIPRIYLTGGKGFQMNIDFDTTVMIPNEIKRDAIRKYLLHLKKKYKLKTLDEVCINNIISCLRRIPNTQYISKATKEPTGVWCTQFTVEEIMTTDITDLYTMAMEGPRGKAFMPNRSMEAQRNFIEFVCDMLDIRHTVSNTNERLIHRITEEKSSIKTGSTSHAYISSEYIKPPRECILKLIERNIKRGHSSHEHNNIIAFELINAGWSDKDISFVFQSIYDEPAGDWGWYTDNPDIAGRHIISIRAKGINRYSKDKLHELKLCNTKRCLCGD